MNWFRGNRFLVNFLIGVGVCLVGAIWFLISARNGWDAAAMRFSETAAELRRLEQLAPYPSDENLRAMKAHADDYATALTKLKDELKARAFPILQIAPNEFQSSLRLTTSAVTDKARAIGVRLPDRFFLGFDEFASSLPGEVVAPLLGQELAQIEWLLDTLIESRVDALTSFRRIPSREEQATELLERKVVEATFVSTPAAARRVLNRVAGADEHFFIVRFLQVRNDKDKGPSREATGETSRTAAPPPASAGSPEATPAPALSFIVGNERIETTAKIEIVRFRF